MRWSHKTPIVVIPFGIIEEMVRGRGQHRSCRASVAGTTCTWHGRVRHVEVIEVIIWLSSSSSSSSSGHSTKTQLFHDTCILYCQYLSDCEWVAAWVAWGRCHRGWFRSGRRLPPPEEAPAGGAPTAESETRQERAGW